MYARWFARAEAHGRVVVSTVHRLKHMALLTHVACSMAVHGAVDKDTAVGMAGKGAGCPANGRQTLLEIATDNPTGQLRILEKLVQRAGLEDALDADGPINVFVRMLVCVCVSMCVCTSIYVCCIDELVEMVPG